MNKMNIRYDFRIKLFIREALVQYNNKNKSVKCRKHKMSKS